MSFENFSQVEESSKSKIYMFPEESKRSEEVLKPVTSISLDQIVEWKEMKFETVVTNVIDESTVSDDMKTKSLISVAELNQLESFKLKDESSHFETEE